jgi:hypothetical protein
MDLFELLAQILADLVLRADFGAIKRFGLF